MCKTHVYTTLSLLFIVREGDRARVFRKFFSLSLSYTSSPTAQPQTFVLSRESREKRAGTARNRKLGRPKIIARHTGKDRKKC